MSPVRALPHPLGRAFQDQWDSEKSLTDRVAQLLDRIDYRQAETDEQREQIFRLRKTLWKDAITLTCDVDKSLRRGVPGCGSCRA